MALEKQKVEKYKAEVQDYGERLGKEVRKMIDCSKTINYLLERNRMCGFCGGCEKCPLYKVTDKENMNDNCDMIEEKFPDKAITIVQEWSDEHQKKTYLSEFLKHYPNAPRDEDETPDNICPYDLGLKSEDCENCHHEYNRVECWNKPLPDEEGEKMIYKRTGKARKIHRRKKPKRQALLHKRGNVDCISNYFRLPL